MRYVLACFEIAGLSVPKSTLGVFQGEIIFSNFISGQVTASSWQREKDGMPAFTGMANRVIDSSQTSDSRQDITIQKK